MLFVAGAAALVVRVALGGEAQEMTQQVAWFPPVSRQLPLTLLLTAAAGWLGLRLRFPSGAMLFPMLIGALVLSLASVFSKNIVPGVIIPVGIVTSLVGVPFFLSIIIRNRGNV